VQKLVAVVVRVFPMNFKEIVNDSKLPWLELAIQLPYEEMLAEAVAVKDMFVKHRDEDHGSYRHKGWRSLCLHGIDPYKTNHYEQYGYSSNEDTPYKWTEVADKCPINTNFFRNIFPFASYYRLRFMLLEPGGYITPHTDSDIHKLSPINIALNNPKGCKFKMKDHPGYVPFADGKAIVLDVGNTHAVFNDSDEDRYHIIVHGKANKEYEKLIERSYEINGPK